MNSSIRNIQLVAVIVVLVSTIIAFFLEMKEMYENKDITLADLLLMFIYIEVIGLVRSYWETQSVRITYPLIIAITALARFIILKDNVKAITPVPGGVGPMTIACLLKNTLTCFKARLT